MNSRVLVNKTGIRFPCIPDNVTINDINSNSNLNLWPGWYCGKWDIFCVFITKSYIEIKTMSQYWNITLCEWHGLWPNRRKCGVDFNRWFQQIPKGVYDPQSVFCTSKCSNMLLNTFKYHHKSWKLSFSTKVYIKILVRIFTREFFWVKEFYPFTFQAETLTLVIELVWTKLWDKFEGA
jgi:hypothetical protein